MERSADAPRDSELKTDFKRSIAQALVFVALVFVALVFVVVVAIHIVYDRTSRNEFFPAITGAR